MPYQYGRYWLHEGFGRWLAKCDGLVRYYFGRGVFAMPHLPWSSWFNSGMSICDAVHTAFDRWGVPRRQLDVLDDFEDPQLRYAFPPLQGVLDTIVGDDRPSVDMRNDREEQNEEHLPKL